MQQATAAVGSAAFIEWPFGVKLIRTSTTREPGAQYPRVSVSHGEAPPQYLNLDEDDWEEQSWPPRRIHGTRHR
jgi:hypothetical protein